MAITNPNLGPLTTTYSASGVNCDSIFATNGLILIRGTITDSESLCQPSAFVPWDGYYYSPGVCPSANTYACFADVGDGGTAATCCPTYKLWTNMTGNSGYNCRINRAPIDDHACDSTLLTDTSVTISGYFSTGDGTISTKVTTFYPRGNIVFAQGVVVRRGQNDPTWPILTTDSTTSTISDQSSNSPTSAGPLSSSVDIGLTTNAQGSYSPTSIGLGNDSANTSLTTGAKVGIGVEKTAGTFEYQGGIPESW
ncbi:hypothetical protein HD806DRAFT_527488 [Xylariaceae sp. AK1471]|nr:hypothetical protein HD806DRAFT_527488 [Xylariaceae sp. AK1471]